METIFPCEQCVKVTKGGCCRTLPIMTYEEAAKIMYKHGDIVKGKNLKLTQVSLNGVVYYSDRDKVVGNNLIVDEDTICPFFDEASGKCSIYEDRPMICRNYGYEEPFLCPYKGEKEVKEIRHPKRHSPIDFLSKKVSWINEYFKEYKMLKEWDVKKTAKLLNQKEFQHLLIVGNYIGHIALHTDYLDGELVYGFVKREKSISPFQRLNIKAQFPFRPLAQVYNFVQRKILLCNDAVLKPFEDKMNRALKHLERFDEDNYKPQELLLFAIFYFKIFQERYKGKRPEYKGLLKTDEIYEAEKKLISELGFSSLIRAMQDENIKSIYETADRVYRVVQSLK